MKSLYEQPTRAQIMLLYWNIFLLLITVGLLVNTYIPPRPRGIGTTCVLIHGRDRFIYKGIAPLPVGATLWDEYVHRVKTESLCEEMRAAPPYYPAGLRSDSVQGKLSDWTDNGYVLMRLPGEGNR